MAYISFEEVKEILKKSIDETTNINEALEKTVQFIYSKGYEDGSLLDRLDVRYVLSDLPSAQPEPSIPLSWIEQHIEWLKSLDNGFSTLTATQISAMVKKWRNEQNDV